MIWGDDIGTWNVGAYTHGMMGRTPNIDSIAKEGMLFTDHYGQPSCTAGRAAFIMGQLPVRTGMTTIGIPGSTRGIQKEDPTLAEVLKSVGYATASSARTIWATATSSCRPCTASTNGSAISTTSMPRRSRRSSTIRARRIPTYTQDSSARVACCTPGRRTWTIRPIDPKFGRVGKQKIENTGPLTRKRMETFDGEVLDQTLDWLDRNGKGGKPFFCWFNTTAIHIWSHPPQKYVQMAVDEGRAEEDVCRAKMIEHDEQVGALLEEARRTSASPTTRSSSTPPTTATN